MSKHLFILNDPPYGTERSYNGLRLRRRPTMRSRSRVRSACSRRADTMAIRLSPRTSESSRALTVAG